MRFYHQQHRFYCGVDLHARTMYLCILDQAGVIVFHQNLAAEPAAFLKAIAPSATELVVAASACSPGTGSPISARPSTSPSCSATPCT